MSDLSIDERLDLRGVPCPMNFVKAKIKLEDMESGQTLELILDDGEPMRSVPRSVKEEGHKVVSVQKMDGNAYRLVILRGQD